MDVNLDDFRRHYESLSDQALLDLKRDDLIETARDLYDQELAARGLTRPVTPDSTADPATAPALDPGTQLVTAAEFDQLGEARLALALLQAAEIPSTITEDHAGGFRLVVPADHEEQAIEILATPLSDEELAAQAEAAGIEEDLD